MNAQDAINHFGSSDCLYRFDGGRDDLEPYMASLEVSYSYLLGEGCFVRTERPVSDPRLLPIEESV